MSEDPYEPLKDPDIFPHAQDGAHPPEAYALREAYYQTFRKIVFGNSPHISLRERSIVESVADKSNYGLNEAHGVSFHTIQETGENFYDFSALPKQIHERSAASTAFTAAHEVRHAMVYEQAREGVKNTAYYRGKLYQPEKSLYSHVKQLIFQAKTAQELNKQPNQNFGDYIEMAQAFTYLGVNAASNYLSSMTMAAISSLTTPIHRAVARSEEYDCDAFALAVYPEMDLEERNRDLTKRDVPINGWRELPLKRSIRLVATKFMDSAKDMIGLSTHPTPDQRHERLTKLQQQMQNNPKSP